MPTFVVDVAGTFTAQLIVNDGTLDSAPDTVNISTDKLELGHVVGSEWIVDVQVSAAAFLDRSFACCAMQSECQVLRLKSGSLSRLADCPGSCCGSG